MGWDKRRIASYVFLAFIAVAIAWWCVADYRRQHGPNYVDPSEAYRQFVAADKAKRKAQIDKCEAGGGFPVFSAWNGSMIDCKPYPVKEITPQ
jgi:hypothetical protein